MSRVNLEPSIRGTVQAKQVHMGKGVVIEDDVLITGKGGPADEVILGDFCFIGRGSRILAPRFRLGDYSKLHAGAFAHGELPLQIGRNCWIGGNVVLDCMGGLDIDDNVGIGAHSQLWTHIQFGDVVEGCRFFRKKYMHVGKDAWLVGHCIVSPVNVGERSMAMVGSVVTKDMLPNHLYAGVPARDVTEQMGPQFAARTVDEKAAALREMVEAFYAKHPALRGELHVATHPGDRPPGTCTFDVSQRTYTRGYQTAEVMFLKENTPLVKFTPEGAAPFVVPQDRAN